MEKSRLRHSVGMGYAMLNPILYELAGPKRVYGGSSKSVF
jgi:hypothetical protein